MMDGGDGSTTNLPHTGLARALAAHGVSRGCVASPTPSSGALDLACW